MCLLTVHITFHLYGVHSLFASESDMNTIHMKFHIFNGTFRSLVLSNTNKEYTQLVVDNINI